MESSAPYVPLGVLYACLLYLSWTPETMRLMFASEYWLPEVRKTPHFVQLMITSHELLPGVISDSVRRNVQLGGIAKLFSNEMTLASAWIHLLAVDLFAARYPFQSFLLLCFQVLAFNNSECALISNLIHFLEKKKKR